MKFSHAWLETHVEIREDPARAGARLTAAGLPLDALEGAGDRAVYDFDIFPNRPDCMSHRGVAREYAALVGKPLRTARIEAPGGGPPTAGAATIVIEAPDLCHRYSARCVLGVRIGPSPAWLRERLESIGQRSINNVVDATNFVLWDLGHPLHAFDLERLTERRIVVRTARPGERLTTLDGVDRALAPEMLLIADAVRPVALAGIIGGRSSEISGATRDLLLESAWFEPVSVRRTSKALGLRTDASHRFERGADTEGTIPALDRAAALIAEIAGGTVTSGPIDLRPRPAVPVRVRLRPSRARALLGVDLEERVMREALERRELGVAADGGDSWQVAVPSFRRDIEREVDLIEEIARHAGYDVIPSRLPVLPAAPGGGRSDADRRVRLARRALEAAGLSEAVNYSMVERQEVSLFDPEMPGEPLEIQNPLQTQSAVLRTSLLPGLLRNVAHNLNHGLPACHLFEIGTVFRPLQSGGKEERTRAAFVLNGRGLPVHWSLPRRDVDLYDARGAADLLGDRLGISPLTVSSDTIGFLEPGRAARILKGDRRLGVLGEIVGSTLVRYGIERPVFAGEIDLDAVAAVGVTERRYRPIARFPAVRRDLALLVDRGTTFQAIERLVREAATVPIADLEVFDLYRGPGIPEGKVSLAIQIAFQHPERTLATDEVQAAQAAIVGVLDRRLGVTLRRPVDD